MPQRSRAVARLAWITLVANLFVILWGAWVRASGSGAGCGNHWPTCNGVIIPQSPSMHTIVEFTHRVSSGLALLLVVALVLLSRRRLPPGHPARKAAVAAVILMMVEAGIGAGLVKFELVAANASMARAVSLGIHLVNTQFLLSAIALTAWWADGYPRAVLKTRTASFIAAFAGLILVGMAGAVASLGDTLFPARTLAEGMAQDRSPGVNILLHIRIWHPLLAVMTGAGLLLLANRAATHDGRQVVVRAARSVMLAVGAQWCIGLLSLVLLVPIALQLLHLVTADLVWLSVVWLAVTTLADQADVTTDASSVAISASNTIPAPSSI